MRCLNISQMRHNCHLQEGIRSLLVIQSLRTRRGWRTGQGGDLGGVKRSGPRRFCLEALIGLERSHDFGSLPDGTSPLL